MNMSDEEKCTNPDEDNVRKKQKRTHSKVFNIQLAGVTAQRANHPQLLQTALEHSNGRDGNLSTSEEDHASMYD